MTHELLVRHGPYAALVLTGESGFGNGWIAALSPEHGHWVRTLLQHPAWVFPELRPGPVSLDGHPSVVWIAYSGGSDGVGVFRNYVVHRTRVVFTSEAEGIGPQIPARTVTAEERFVNRAFALHWYEDRLAVTDLGPVAAFPPNTVRLPIFYYASSEQPRTEGPPTVTLRAGHALGIVGANEYAVRALQAVGSNGLTITGPFRTLADAQTPPDDVGEVDLWKGQWTTFSHAGTYYVAVWPNTGVGHPLVVTIRVLP